MILDASGAGVTTGTVASMFAAVTQRAQALAPVALSRTAAVGVAAVTLQPGRFVFINRAPVSGAIANSATSSPSDPAS
jgi:hypothetical protein